MLQKQNLLIGILVAAVVIVLGWILFDATKSQQTVSSSAETTSQTNPDSQAPKQSTGDLKIEDIVEGTGQEVKSGDTVVMHYKGTLEDGKQFDSSYDRGEPFETQIGVGAVIQGWDQGVPGMKVGGKRKLIIPPALGYGSQDMGSIPPNSTLIFEVELLEIK